MGFDVVRRAFGNDHAAVFAGAGADVDDPVGGADGLFVMLDDHDGVAEVAQAFEGADEARVVALVETDAGLIKDVHDADEAGADLGGEADALGLAAGEGAGGAFEGEVLKADGFQEAEAGVDFLENLDGDGGVALAELEAVEEGGGVLDGQGGGVVDGTAADSDGHRFWPEPSAQADGAHAAGHVALDFAADVLGLGVFVAATQVGDDAFELELVGAAAAGGVGVLDDQGLAGRAVEDDVDDGGVEALDGGVGAEAVFAGEGFDDVAGHGALAGVGLEPGGDGALGDGEGTVGNDEGGVEFQLGTEAVAVGAGAVGGVEGEEAGFEVGEADVAVLAGEALAEG